MDDEYDGDTIDSSLNTFETYEDYLDSFITPLDLFYLEDKELARQLNELGYHGRGEILTREQFAEKKQSIEEAIKNKNAQQPKALSHVECKIDDNEFLLELAKREEKIRNGRLITILFLRYKDEKKEISGYVDLYHRLKTEDFKQYFKRNKILMPKPTDLSFYNWETQKATCNESPNFRVDANTEAGLMFRNKRDRKQINVDPGLYINKESKHQNTNRTEIVNPKDSGYAQIVFLDHMTRRKNN